ncbi:MAG: transglutaminase N-terminal domain-containing protein [Alphaproteobacteria bacterium]
MNFRIRHATTYRYAQPVAQSMQLLHLVPRATPRQAVRDSTVVVHPRPTQRVLRRDAFGNHVEWMALEEAHLTLEIVAESRIVATTMVGPDGGGVPWEMARTGLEAPADDATRRAVDFVFDSPHVRSAPEIVAYARKSFPAGRPVLQGAVELMRRIHADFRYDTTVTDATTPVERVFAIRAGVCQDLAHVGIACLRAMGLPARYVSGYLLTEPPPGMPRLVGADASHAWFAAWCPPFGWVDLDPTNDVMPDEGHVTVAWGRDYGDVAPISGVVVGGGDHTIEVGVDVVPT